MKASTATLLFTVSLAHAKGLPSRPTKQPACGLRPFLAYGDVPSSKTSGCYSCNDPYRYKNQLEGIWTMILVLATIKCALFIIIVVDDVFIYIQQILKLERGTIVIQVKIL
ncbi:hypothetical protein Ptr902_03853 [Pyrenophora tritici-repentis]|nr:hypothetical protein Ptr902_03853 [Pyrenophora tritici-repentis]